MYVKRSIERYTDDLAARKSTPGGGSAAALEGALGSSLLSMVANYTISNKGYRQFEDKAKDSLKRSENFRKELLRLVDEDVKVYKKLSGGLKKFGRGSLRLQRLYKDACNAPYKICKLTSEALALCRELAQYANKDLVTDTAMAALMLESAFFGAKFNAYINLRYISDDKYIEEMHKVLSDLEETVPKLKEEVLERCQQNF